MVLSMSIILVFATYLAGFAYAVKIEQQSRRERVRIRSEQRRQNVIFLRQSLKMRPSYEQLYSAPIVDDQLPKKLKKNKVA